jgi:hypothetical protein
MFAQRHPLAATVAVSAIVLAFGAAAHGTMPRTEMRAAADGIGTAVQHVAVHRNCRIEGGRRVCGVYRSGSLRTPTPTESSRMTRFGFSNGGSANTFLHHSSTTGSGEAEQGTTLRSVFSNSVTGAGAH